MISRERGPGISVTSWIAGEGISVRTIPERRRSLPALSHSGRRAPEVYSPLAFQSRNPLPALANSQDLVLDISEREAASQREVLDPRNELGVAAAHGCFEVAQRVGDGRSGNGLRIGQPVLSCAEVRGVDHRRDRVDSTRYLLRRLPDTKLVGRRQPENVGRDADTERLELTGRVAEEVSDRRRLRLVRLARPDSTLHRAVRWKSHIVELNLVESGLGGGLGNRDVVLPNFLVVLVRPAEASVVEPGRAVGVLDGQIGSTGREHGILEDRDTADQVDALGVKLLSHAGRVIEVPCRSDLAG